MQASDFYGPNLDRSSGQICQAANCRGGVDLIRLAFDRACDWRSYEWIP